MDAMVEADPGGTIIQATALRCPELFEDGLGWARAAAEAADAPARACDTGGSRPSFDEALAPYKAFDAAWDASRVLARMRARGMRPGGRQSPSRPRTGWTR